MVNSYSGANGGVTPLTFACLYNNVRAVKALLDCGADANKPDQSGQFPLSIAEEKGNEEIQKLLDEKMIQHKFRK